MTRGHAMPFGAELRDGGVAFRLWAPGAADVDVVVDGAAPRAMTTREGGWKEAFVAGVGAGARYAFRVPGGLLVPDPASRANPDGVHDASMVVDPGAHAWRNHGWRGRPWSEAVLYELHVGTFTPEGTYTAAAARLAALAELGVTAIELMPLAAFPGRRNWGYDGVLPFAPTAAYGTPDDLKRLVDDAHGLGLMVFLDVVYNHFGPDGNYLHVYAPQFFNPRHQTPWGAGIDFDGEHRETVRAFFVHNALYWLDEYRFDGLRLDAIHAIADDSPVPIAAEIASRVREHFAGRREVHVVLENDHNDAALLRRDDAGQPVLATAQWNDDLHHALHVLATGERDGYYADYASQPLHAFGRALAEGFVYQGQPSPYRSGARRGQPSVDLPPAAFVPFAQNHDQVGNRAMGERIVRLADPAMLRALMACVLVAPAPPLLFMGEEFGATTPFLYFCDFSGDLAAAVTRGRREEFASFRRFQDEEARRSIPDPNHEATFVASRLDWGESDSADGRAWRAFYQRCLGLRRDHVVTFTRTVRNAGSYKVDGPLLRVTWAADDASRLHLVANLSPQAIGSVVLPSGDRFLATGTGDLRHAGSALMPCDVLAIVERGSR